MSIEKKSLISNRTVTKKAIIVKKPEVSTVAPARLAKLTRLQGKVRIGVAHISPAYVRPLSRIKT
jgi:hypothetical protein